MAQELPFGAIRVVVNERQYEIDSHPPWLPLLDWLRTDLRLVGAKEGCSAGECGACTIHELDDAGRASAVLSCLVPLAAAHGRSFRTIEGAYETPELRRAEQALDGALQCGFCGPGLAMGLSTSAPEKVLDGHLCRCTGYRGIRAAAARCSGQQPCEQGPPAAARLHPGLRYRYGGSTWFRPSSLDELWRALEAHPGAVLVAGGTGSPAGRTELRWASVVVLLDGLPELAVLDAGGGRWRIGALTPVATLARLEGLELLGEAASTFGTEQIRGQATLGGNLAIASSVADLVPPLVALGAEVVVLGPTGARRLLVEELAIAPGQVCLDPHEVIGWVEVSCPGDRAATFHRKVMNRRAADVAILSIAGVLDLDEDGFVSEVRLALGGVDALPVRASAAEHALLGHGLTPERVEEAVEALQGDIHPRDDHRGTAAARRRSAANLLRRWLGAVAEGRPTPRAIRASAETTGSSSAAPPPAEPPEGWKAAFRSYRFLADEPMPAGMVHVAVVQSPHASARIVRVSAQRALQAPGVMEVLLAQDIPGANEISATVPGEPLLASGRVDWVGQPVAIVVADRRWAALGARELVDVEYEVEEPILSFGSARERGNWLCPPLTIDTGGVDGALEAAPFRRSGATSSGEQEHYYLEPQCARATLGDGERLSVRSSTQHPVKVQQTVAAVLGRRMSEIVVAAPRVGGAFGGKETQATRWACLAAMAAVALGRPAECRLDRESDLAMTGKRHPMETSWEVGFDEKGLIRALRVHLDLDGGAHLDLSRGVLERALLHLDNAYYLPAAQFVGRVVRTNKAPNTAMRGFGVPQAVLVIEQVMDAVAEAVGRDPLEVRRANLYGLGSRSRAPWGGQIPDLPMAEILDTLETRVDLARLREEVERHNAAGGATRLGMAVVPVRFGVGFSNTFSNQASATVTALADGTVQVAQNGVELGQGLHQRLRSLCARELGVAEEAITILPPSSDRMSNSSATAASSSFDLNGAAVRQACRELRRRLAEVAAGRLSCGVEDIHFMWKGGRGKGWASAGDDRSTSFADICRAAHRQQVSLLASGYHSAETTGAVGGKPFRYQVCGATAVVVEVDVDTGERWLKSVEIVHEVGAGSVSVLDLGQIEGAFVMGVEWSLSGSQFRSARGTLVPGRGAAVPTCEDVAVELLASRWWDAHRGENHRPRLAIGEPPLALAVASAIGLERALRARGRPSEGELGSDLDQRGGGSEAVAGASRCRWPMDV